LCRVRLKAAGFTGIRAGYHKGKKTMQGILENGMPAGVGIPFPKMPCSAIVPPNTLQILSEVFSILKNPR
jgi:hypothetical protein